MRKTLFSIVILAGYVSPGYTQDQPETAAQIAHTRGSDARELFEESKPFFGDNAADSSFSPDVAINDGPKLGEFQEGVRKISLKEKLRGEAAEEEKLEKAMMQAKLGLAKLR